MKGPRTADIIITALSLAFASVAAFAVFAGYSAPEIVEVTSQDGAFIYSLDSDRELPVTGPLGDSIIMIRGREAYFKDSPCPDKLCVKSGHLHDSGQWAGCLPNRVFIRIKGKEDENTKVDSLSF